MSRSASANRAGTVAVPVSPRLLWRLLGGGFAMLGIAAVVVGAIASGLPRSLMQQAVVASSSAGYAVRRVDISGVVHQPRLSIYRQLLDGGSDSMLLADLPAMRARLETLPWVRAAAIERRWPDRLIVRITERQPAALWQRYGAFRLMDAHGVLLPATDLSPFAHLPLLVGPGADVAAADILRLLAAHPELAGQVQAVQRIGARRWDIRMKSGETIALPEGQAAAGALARFAGINRATPLLGRGFVRFDLRIPDKMVVRVQQESGLPPRPRAAPAIPGLAPGGRPVAGLEPAGQPQPRTAPRVTQEKAII